MPSGGGWRGWIAGVQEEVDRARSLLHGRERLKMRERIGAFVAARDAKRAQGGIGKVIKSVLGRVVGSPLIGRMERAKEGGAWRCYQRGRRGRRG